MTAAAEDVNGAVAAGGLAVGVSTVLKLVFTTLTSPVLSQLRRA
jgi:hypothetical protein